MAAVTKRLSVDQYDQMVKHGILPETNRFELIEGRIVEKDVKAPTHSTIVDLTRSAIEPVLPAGWFIRKEDPIRIPNRRSEPEPDLAVVRGTIKDYATRHPGPEDVALVVEVTRSTVTKDRALARVYAGGDIPAYWIVDVARRRLEVHENPAGGRYASRRVLNESDIVSLNIDGQEIGPFAIAKFFP